MATKISEVVDSLLAIQKIHGDLPVMALTCEEDDDEDGLYPVTVTPSWQQAEVKEGRNGEAIVVKIEGLA